MSFKSAWWKHWRACIGVCPVLEGKDGYTATHQED
jgi:hypothetical protein